MDVRIETPDAVFIARGKNCYIKKKTVKTRLGKEFRETIVCEKFKIEKE